jgi:prefoldin subunit 5
VGRAVVDRLYKARVPELRRALEELAQDFARLDSRTNWARLRVAPVLKHARALEQILNSPKFSRELERLNRGVELFRSDLVYLRANVAGLERLLSSSKQSKPPARRRP